MGLSGCASHIIIPLMVCLRDMRRQHSRGDQSNLNQVRFSCFTFQLLQLCNHTLYCYNRPFDFGELQPLILSRCYGLSKQKSICYTTTQIFYATTTQLKVALSHVSTGIQNKVVNVIELLHFYGCQLLTIYSTSYFNLDINACCKVTLPFFLGNCDTSRS